MGISYEFPLTKQDGVNTEDRVIKIKEHRYNTPAGWEANNDFLHLRGSRLRSFTINFT